MKTSLIIPTYNPNLKLEETIRKLLPQSSFIDELIIIIDNDNYSDFSKSLSEEYSTKLKIIIYAQPNSGRAISRNKGSEISSGDLLIFLDDDMLAEQNLLEKHIQYHLKNPNLIVSGNGYRNPEKAPSDFGRFLINMESEWKKESPDIGEITFQKFNFTACNLSLPKYIFNQLGGFDSRFSDNEDFDFAVRAINKGIRIQYDNTLLAWHNDWPDISTFIKRQNEYTSGKAAILKIHPRYMEDFPNLLVIESSKAKKMISSIARATVGKWVIAKNGIFEMLPISIKFFLYRMTISAYSSINS